MTDSRYCCECETDGALRAVDDRLMQCTVCGHQTETEQDDDLPRGAKITFYWDAADREYGYTDPDDILSGYEAGDVVAIEHVAVAVVRTTYNAFLPAADDALTDERWRVEVDTPQEAETAVAAELRRRAK